MTSINEYVNRVAELMLSPEWDDVADRVMADLPKHWPIPQCREIWERAAERCENEQRASMEPASD